MSDQTTFRSLAVLPFERLSADAEEDYLTDGISDALTTELARTSGLKVISRTSAMQYKAARKPLSYIARELGVDIVLEGTVLSVDGRIRVSAQLIEGSSDRHLWSRSYEYELKDVLTLVLEVAARIAAELRPCLGLLEERPASVVGREINRRAYKAYLKGIFHVHRFTREGFEAGLRHLHEAIEIDPADPLPYAGLARGYSLIGHSSTPSPDAYPRARAAALMALRLNDTFAEAHEVLAEVKLYHEWDFAGAGQAFDRALALDPNSAWAPTGITAGTCSSFSDTARPSG